MAINLDEIVANSNSVDELVAALGSEAQAAQVAGQQMAQVADAATKTSPLDWFKKLVSPKSTAGALDMRQEYKRYYNEQLDKGEDVVPYEEFVKQRKEEQAKPKTVKS